MTVYKILSDPAFALVYPDFATISLRTPDRAGFLLAKSGKEPFGNAWVESPALLDEGKTIPDISRLSGPHLVFSPAARDCVAGLLNELGEWLPVVLGEATYWLFNCQNQIDEVDEHASRLDEYEEIQALGFLPEQVAGQIIWCTTYGVGRGMFCTDRLRDLVESNALTGLCFSRDLTARN